MISWMTLSSMSLIRNHQRPQSTPPSCPPIPDTLIIKISTLNFQGFFIRVKNIFHDIKDDPVFHVPDQEPSMSSKYPPSRPSLPDTLLIKISTQNFQGIFLWVKKHVPWHQGWPCPPCLWSKTLKVLQIPPSLTPEGPSNGQKVHQMALRRS